MEQLSLSSLLHSRGVNLPFLTPPIWGGSFILLVAVSTCFLNKIHRGDEIVSEKFRESFSLSDIFFGVGY